MIVEKGGFYEDAKGKKQGPMAGETFKFARGHYWYINDPSWNNDGTGRNGTPDLIRKWVEPDTLKNLGVKPGDVVGWMDREYIAFEEPKPKCAGHIWAGTGRFSKTGSIGWIDADTPDCRIVSRAADTPPIFKDMTDAEKGALLLAKHKGKPTQVWDKDAWIKSGPRARPNDHLAYRIAPTYITGRVQEDADGNPDFSTWEADQ